MTDRRILVPVDGSERSTEGLRYALEEYPDADVVALHVMPPAGWDPEEPPPPREAIERMHDQRRAEADAVLEAAAAVGAEYDAAVDTVLETGEPWRAIVEYVRETGIDHVVMGSHGQTDPAGTGLGSVAETVVRRAPAVVSVVR